MEKANRLCDRIAANDANVDDADDNMIMKVHAADNDGGDHATCANLHHSLMTMSNTQDTQSGNEV